MTTPPAPEGSGERQIVCKTPEEYRGAVISVIMAAKILSQFDLPKLLESIEHADSFGCFTDPTLWIQNRGKMNEDREIIEAALPLYRMAMKIKNMPLGTRT